MTGGGERTLGDTRLRLVGYRNKYMKESDSGLGAIASNFC